jgi:hypothetical protein
VELLSLSNHLADLNLRQSANVFVGVNPRPSFCASRKRDINKCRCVWVDLDSISPAAAIGRWQALELPEPTMAVNSGSGIHAYWLLAEPYRIHSVNDRVRFETMLKNLYRELGGDATHDVTRFLRLPGFWNVKNARNGQPPVPCELVSCDAMRRYTLETFARWHEPFVSPGSDDENGLASRPTGKLPGCVRERTDRTDVNAIVADLDCATRDLSRRDYAVVCRLLRLGIPSDEIRQLIADKSKFRTNGSEYLETTLANALREVGHDRL